ncbi:hypothetical protein AB1Y20_009990 [Prymnesium parvum]
MLLYPHSFSGLPLLFTVAGSAIPRAVFPALLSTMLCLIIEKSLSPEFLSHLMAHPYPYTVFANVVGFALVFRTNIAYNRYWEGIGHLRTMSAKWGDAAINIISFDCHEKAPGEGEHTLKSTRLQFYAAICHNFSLMHALACAHLRREVRLRNFKSAQVWPKVNISRRPIKATAEPLDCAYGLRQSFWPSGYNKHLQKNPLSVLGGLSDSEKHMLENLDSEARVAYVYTRLLALVNTRRAGGGLWVDPPAVSRIHQQLSDGSLGFYQASKLEDTPLPFPYAQMVSVVLFIFAITYPMLASAKASGYDGMTAHWLAPSLSFIVVLCYFALHEVARELEDPFIHPPNEAPVVALQHTFNSRIVTGWEAAEYIYSTENVPDGMSGLGLRGIVGTGAEVLSEQWGRRHEIQEQVLQHQLTAPVVTPPRSSSRIRTGDSASVSLQSLPSVELSDASINLTPRRDRSCRWNHMQSVN